MNGDYLSAIIQGGALVVLAGVLWHVFRYMIPRILDGFHVTIKAQRDAFLAAQTSSRDAFREELAHQRTTLDRHGQRIDQLVAKGTVQ